MYVFGVIFICRHLSAFTDDLSLNQLFPRNFIPGPLECLEFQPVIWGFLLPFLVVKSRWAKQANI